MIQNILQVSERNFIITVCKAESVKKKTRDVMDDNFGFKEEIIETRVAPVTL